MIHPTAVVDPNAVLGHGVTVWQFASILAGTIVGMDAVIGSGCWIGKNCRIGQGVHINHGCFLPHGSQIGRDVFIGPNVTFTDDKHPVAGNKNYRAQPPVVHRGASIGAGAVILPGVVIGEGATVAAGAVVTKDVASNVTVIGMPARSRAVQIYDPMKA